MSAIGATAAPGFFPHAKPEVLSKTNRPIRSKRKFRSEAVESSIRRVKAEISNKELAWMFENCFPNTLDTTVSVGNKSWGADTFIITGDIPAMWLRDSTAQVWPYLSFVKGDPKLRTLFQGLINRQAACIRMDPYANAFNNGPTGSYWKSDFTKMIPELHERKWEIDSLCYPVRLAHGYHKETGDTSVFGSAWFESAKLILQTFKEQQRKDGPGPYRFMRKTPKASDTLPGNGYGNPVKPNGLICSSFRPSDDATIYPYLIPSNLFAVKSLRQLGEMASNIGHDEQFAMQCEALADEVEEAVYAFAVYDHPGYGKILAYEIDGFMNRLFMDDANVPSLLSLPYLGCIDRMDPVYQNTRRYILSDDNPWYFTGTAGCGIGGPHVGIDMIWPMSIIMQALTSDDEEEIRKCVKMLMATHAGTGFMHETFHKDNPDNYTRSWFAWANTLFGELILKTYHENPMLLKSF